MPKHYKPALCEKRLKNFAENFKNPAFKEAASYLEKKEEPEKPILNFGEDG